MGFFKKKEPSSRRETRGAGSSAPMRSSYNEDLEPFGVIVLARETDVRSSVYHVMNFYKPQVYAMNLLVLSLMHL